MVIRTPRYRMHRFTISDDGDDHSWFSVEVQLNMTVLKSRYYYQTFAIRLNKPTSLDRITRFFVPSSPVKVLGSKT